MASIITTTLAMDELKEACDKFADFEAQRAAALAARDHAIKDAAQYVSVSSLQRITGLSRQRLYRIIGGPVERFPKA